MRVLVYYVRGNNLECWILCQWLGLNQDTNKRLQDCFTKKKAHDHFNTFHAITDLVCVCQVLSGRLILMVLLMVQAARGQIEQAISMRKRFNHAAEATRLLKQNLPSNQLNSTPSQRPFTQPVISFAPLKTIEEDNKKAAAAAVAAKLAASTSSALMLSSVLSSLVAEEVASLNGSSKSGGFNSEVSIFNPEKRPRLEKPLPVSDIGSSDIGSSSFFPTLQHPSMLNVPVAPSPSLQSQDNQLHSPPPLSPANQYVQSTGLMLGGMPFGYGSSNLAPPLPLPPHSAIGLSRPSTQPSQVQQAQQQTHQSATGGFYTPPGMGFYRQNHPSMPPSIPRQ